MSDGARNQPGATLALHELMTISARRVTRMLAIIAPCLCAVSLATGEAELDTTLVYLSVVETGFVALWWLARGSAAERWPEWLLFGGTLLASGGVIFSPTHGPLGYKPYAMLAPMAAYTFAAIAPLKPWLTYLLAAGTAALYALSLRLVPAERTIDPVAYAAVCWAMAWMGATFARDLRGLWRDLDDARRRALDATRLKSEFLTNMSHEIRTPMTAILGFAEEVELGLSEAPATALTGAASMRGALATIRRNGVHLLTLINGILDVSKIEAGKLEVAREPCAVLALAAEVSSLLRSQAREKGLAFETVVSGAIPEIIDSDRTRLRQILINLVGNAVKFTERGSVRIEIRLVAPLDDRAGAGMLEIAVADSGCGVAADQVGRLFESFTQVHGSLTRVHQGTGLGLALSRKLARLLGGDIDVETQIGVGSRFRLRLPVAQRYGLRLLTEAEANAIAAADETPALGSDVARTQLAGRVLLVEDGLDNQRLIGGILRRAGLEIEIAEDGERGCALALSAEANGDAYDLILMDMQMPVLDGYTAVQRLRAAGYAGAIIALTAHAMAGDRERCLALGCSDYATKPIAREDLLAKVAAHVRKPAAH